jgi:hypothetical protein
MDLLRQYLARADEIIGERTKDEIRYDNEVIRYLRRGKNITKAIAKANEKYPSEALAISEELLPDIHARYEYLLEHEEIMKKMKLLK